MPSTEVVTVGNIVADLIAPSTKRIPKWGQLIEAPSISLTVGGNAAIFASCLARLGVRASLLGGVGNDILGSFLLENLKKIGVDTSRVKIDPGANTSVTLAISNPKGERLFIHDYGANAKFGKGDVDARFIARHKLLHLCAYNLVPMLVGEPTLEIMRSAKNKGLTTTFDVSWDPSGRWRVDGILRYTDLFLPNEEEARHITGASTPIAAASKLVEDGPGTVVIKLGPRGCLVRTSGGEEFRSPGFKVPVLDTTGAGDAFNSGFVYGLLKDWDLRETARFANAVAALTVTKPGGTTGAPTLGEVTRFLEERLQ
ncbi:MAG: carbohydrate kinase family protein [Candidatus Bathyarchaeia archaeon]